MTATIESRESLAETLKVLADPTRLAILDLLRNRDQCVCHIVETLDLKQSAISHHLGTLRRSGMVLSYPHAEDRRWLYYRLNREAIDTTLADLNWLADDSQYDPTPMPCPIDAPASETA